MDYRAIALPIGRLLILIAGFMLIPAAADLMAGNPDWKAFLGSALMVAGAGALVSSAFAGRAFQYRPRETFIFVNAAWLVFTVAGALPLYASGLDLTFTDAFFESASGLTTTGSTILTGLDQMPPGILVWRSLMQWIGGIGIVVFGIWLLPGLRIGGSQLFSIESSENSSKPYGRIEPFLFRLMALYGALTAACTVFYLLCGMPAFQAVNHALTTVSTGGYSTSDLSFGQFDGVAVYWVSIVFMTASSVPFLVMIRLAEGKRVEDTSQIMTFILVLLVASFAVFLVERFQQDDTPFHLFTLAVFHVVSVVTTTGYASTDYLGWGPFVIAMFFLLTFLGGCSGSTSGGFKMFRIVVVLGQIRTMLRRMVRPHRVVTVRYSGKPVNASVIEGVFVFGILYAGTFAVFSGICSMYGLDLQTALSASITALANVGPGVGDIIGPAGNFASLPDGVKWSLAVEMILGRLEIIAGLVVLSPDFWLEV